MLFIVFFTWAFWRQVPGPVGTRVFLSVLKDRTLANFQKCFVRVCGYMYMFMYLHILIYIYMYVYIYIYIYICLHIYQSIYLLKTIEVRKPKDLLR